MDLPLPFLEAAKNKEMLTAVIAPDYALMKLLRALSEQSGRCTDPDSMSRVFKSAMDAAVEALDEDARKCLLGSEQVKEARQKLDYYGKLAARLGINIPADEPSNEINITRDGVELEPRSI